jgi:NADH-quinone oxidoreductase subunit L
MTHPHLADIGWIVLCVPLLAAALITLVTQRDARLSAQLSIGAVAVSFVLSLGLFISSPAVQPAQALSSSSFTWLVVGNFNIEFGLTLDPLSLLMLLVVTGVAATIHIYSYGYMAGDRGFSRYFAGLSLFTFAMLGIVLADSFVVMFVFWELVGFSSYFLIGFWYERASAADAAKKAFLTNRLGDFGFLLGIILLWSILGSQKFSALQEHLSRNPGALGIWSSIAGLLIFCGAVGKSAQFPLHVWLPDAMEGPTPVSALIHAATMVAAGVYMLCRVFFLYAAAPAWPQALSYFQGITALDVIAWIGGFTSLLGALIAIQQNDIKRILAYSTLSQLGYMVMAVGLSGPSAAIYHLATHAFFKALLFLGAGSVIYALHHEQDIWKMGGLSQRMPWTYRTFVIGTLALCGVPPFSGFFSKDAILATAASQNIALFILGSVVAMLTTFYMFRLVFVAFTGTARSEEAGHAEESPRVMSVPLLLLAVPSLLAGLWGIDAFLNWQFKSEQPAIPSQTWLGALFAPFGHAPLAVFVGLGAIAFGFSFAYAHYAGAAKDPLPEKIPGLSRAMRNRFYFDELYARLIASTHEALARFVAAFDRWIISGVAIRGLQGTTDILGRALRLVQTGNLQTYALMFVFGLVIIVYAFLRH